MKTEKEIKEQIKDIEFKAKRDLTYFRFDIRTKGYYEALKWVLEID